MDPLLEVEGGRERRGRRRWTRPGLGRVGGGAWEISVARRGEAPGWPSELRGGWRSELRGWWMQSALLRGMGGVEAWDAAAEGRSRKESRCGSELVEGINEFGSGCNSAGEGRRLGFCSLWVVGSGCDPAWAWLGR